MRTCRQVRSGQVVFLKILAEHIPRPVRFVFLFVLAGAALGAQKKPGSGVKAAPEGRGKTQLRLLQADRVTGGTTLCFRGKEPWRLRASRSREAGGVLHFLGENAGQNEKLFLFIPFFRREGAGKPAVLFLGEKKAGEIPVSVSEGWRGFAVGLVPGIVRKEIIGLPAGMSTEFWGGSTAPPDPVPRRGPTSADGLPREVYSSLPSVASGEGRLVFAWCRPGPDSYGDVWVGTSEGKATRLAGNGRAPQVAAGAGILFCAWETGEGLFLSRSFDNGKTWRGSHVVRGGRTFSGLRIAARGKSVALVWQCPEGIRFVVSRNGGNSFGPAGELQGPFSKPVVFFDRSGKLLLAYLRKGVQGWEAVLQSAESVGKRREPEVLLGRLPVFEVALWETRGGLVSAFVVSVGGRRRLAFKMARGAVYLLPATPVEPFLVDGGLWDGRLCVSFCLRSKKGIESYAFLSGDGGYSWSGPLRLVTPRSLCAFRAEAVVGWEGAAQGGMIRFNGKEAIALPPGVPSGQAVVSIPPGALHPQGWIADTVSYQGSGKVRLSVLFRTLPFERVAYGRNQAHAESLAGGLRKVSKSADLVLVAPALAGRRLTVRVGTVLNLAVGVRNVGAGRSESSLLSAVCRGSRWAQAAVSPIAPGEERRVVLDIPAPPVPGTYPLTLSLETAGDVFPFDNSLQVELTVSPAQDVVLSTGRTVSILLEDQKRIRIECDSPSYLLLKSARPGKGAVEAFFITDGGSPASISVGKPVDLKPGRYLLLLRARGTAVRLECTLRRKTDPFEPNDSPALARPIKPGVIVPCSFVPAGDQDWFSLIVPEKGQLAFSKESGGGEPVVSVRTLQGRYLAREQTLPFALAVRQGRYEIVFAERWRRAVEQTVRLRIELIASNDPTEPNDRPQQAIPLPVGGKEVLFELSPRGDIDWFSINVPGSGYLSVKVEAEGRHYVELTLFNEHLEPVGLPRWGSLAFRVEGGKFFLRAGAEASSVKRAKLSAEFRPEFDPTEPNDTPVRASRCGTDSVLRFALWPSGDQDWFAVSVPEAGYLSLELTGPGAGGARPACTVWQEGRVVAALKLLPAVVRVQAGEVFLQFEPLEGSVRPSLIEVSLEFSPELDALEPNDEPRHAASIQCPGSTEVAIWPPDDVDYIALSVREDCYLIVRAEGGKAGLLEIALAGRGAAPEVGFGPQCVFRLSSGRHLLRLRTGERINKPLVLTLMTELKKEIDPGEALEASGGTRDLEPGKQYRTAVFPGRDIDRFKIEVERPGRYVLELTGESPPLDLRFDLAGPQGRAGLTGLRPGQIFSLTPGTHILKLYDARGLGAYKVFGFRLRAL